GNVGFMRMTVKGIAKEKDHIGFAFGDSGGNLCISSMWPGKHFLNFKSGFLYETSGGSRRNYLNIVVFEFVEILHQEIDHFRFFPVVCNDCKFHNPKNIRLIL